MLGTMNNGEWWVPFWNPIYLACLLHHQKNIFIYVLSLSNSLFLFSYHATLDHVTSIIRNFNHRHLIMYTSRKDIQGQNCLFSCTITINIWVKSIIFKGYRCDVDLIWLIESLKLGQFHFFWPGGNITSSIITAKHHYLQK